MDPIDRWWADLQLEQQHRDGGRCPECAPRGGCLALLAVVRRRADTQTTGIRHGLGRLG
ncbi:hypothetical protein [Plantactinospora endophytica]|uniref:hypothetical protein n=1 Tax=Plantactinospora endophytica TaxID=673535 RepID=UPI00194116AB|nr:hypothetical protein [Plantactinospora endophytica]